MVFPATLLLILLTALACSSGNDTKTTKTPAIRQGSTVSPVAIKFFDGHSALSQDGATMAFLSGKSGNNNMKGVLLQNADLESPQRLGSDPDWGAFQALSLATDGSTVAWLADSEGTQGIKIHRVDTPDLVSDGTLTDGIIVSQIALQVGAAGSALAVEGVDTSGDRNISITGFSESSGALALAEPVSVPDLESDEEMFQWLPVDNGLAFITRVMTGGSSQLKVRTTTNNALDGLEVRTIDLASTQDPAPFAVGKGKVAYIGRMTGTMEERARVPYGNKPPDANGVDTKGFVYVDSEVKIVDLDGNEETAIESEQYKIRSVDLTSDGSLGLALGSEVLACEAGDIYGTSLMLLDPGTGKRIRVIPKRQEDGSWTATADPCTDFIADAGDGKPSIDIFLQEAQLAKDPSGKIVILYGSWRSGDAELYRMELTWNQVEGSLQDIKITNISQNAAE